MKIWILSIFALTFLLLAILKTHEVSSLTSFYKAERPIKIGVFQEARNKVNKKDLDLLELWESIMTGRSAPLSRIMKDKYKSLGLNHIFTPSGFHLSAILLPFMRIIKSNKLQLFFLTVIGFGLLFLPGLTALKRMVLIKANQKMLGLQFGFFSGLILDILFGSFQTSTLSFTYSFLFLGIIYSGVRGLKLIVWFFIAQIFLSYFQQTEISILLLIFSPLLNFLFSMAMPVLFLLSIPLWDWQLRMGIFMLSLVQDVVDLAAHCILVAPTFEVTVGILFLVALIFCNRKKYAAIVLIILTGSLNLDVQRTPAPGTYEYRPHGKILRIISRESHTTVYFSDGMCRLKLVRGMWFENCSPKRRSSKRKKIS